MPMQVGHEDGCCITSQRVDASYSFFPVRATDPTPLPTISTFVFNADGPTMDRYLFIFSHSLSPFPEVVDGIMPLVPRWSISHCRLIVPPATFHLSRSLLSTKKKYNELA